MKLESLINKRVDVLGKFGTVVLIARGTLEEHPSGDGSFLLVGLSTYDIQVQFHEENVDRIDEHTDYLTKCTVYLKP